MKNNENQFTIDNLAESLSVEVKNWLGGLQEKETQAKLAKEIIALANHGGGQIYIGFEDEENGIHKEIVPKEGEVSGFSRDKLASVVSRYIEPNFECEIDMRRRTDSEIVHPIILVPSIDKTPVWAKRSSPDETTLKSSCLYIRRPGAQSEPPCDRGDWLNIIDLLVRNRQDELLNAFRNILTPKAIPPESMLQNLIQWDTLQYKNWFQQVEKSQTNQLTKSTQLGTYSFSFRIHGFTSETNTEISQFLRSEMKNMSGFPPFSLPYNQYPGQNDSDGNLYFWLPTKSDGFQDYWKISKQGYGFHIRNFREDTPDYWSIYPKPKYPSFDISVHVYRAAEYVNSVSQIAQKFADINAKIDCKLTYRNMLGRSLATHNPGKYDIWHGGTSKSQEISNSITFNSAETELSLKEIIYRLLAPMFEHFDMFGLEKGLVNYIVDDAKSYQSK